MVKKLVPGKKNLTQQSHCILLQTQLSENDQLKTGYKKVR